MRHPHSLPRILLKLTAPAVTTTLTVAITLLLLLATPPTAAREPLLMAGKKSLYQRVLTRPGAALHNRIGDSSSKPTPVDAFSRFYVYSRQQHQGQSWLQVGVDTRGELKGWLPASQTVAWKQQLTLAFTNPGANRNPVLFFKSWDSLEAILELESPADTIAPLIARIEAGDQDPRIVAIEPKEFIDINQQFYLLPILAFEEVYTESGHSVIALKIASVTRQQPRQAPATAAFSPVQQATQQPTQTLTAFRAAIVFVIDSTISMRKYIDETRAAVKQVYQRIQDAGIQDQVSFGLVGFRAASSNKQRASQLEYIAREFVDPSETDTAEEFLNLAADLHEASVSTDHFDEDAYAGIITALEGIPWNRFGARYIVLITDAGALEGADSNTRLHAEQVRSEAATKGVALYTFHLKTPAGKSNHASAAAKYQTLTHNPTIQKSLYFPIEAGDPKGFAGNINILADSVIDNIRAASRGSAVPGAAREATAVKAIGDPSQQRLRQATAELGHAMQLAYLGRLRNTEAPEVFEAWISDRDLSDPAILSVDQRVLLTKNQLSDLRMILTKILDAADRGVLEPEGFFDSLRSIAASFGRDPNLAMRPNAIKLADLGLMEEYLEDLPYKSDIMNLDQDTWTRWGTQRQLDFVKRLRSKVHLYERYNADNDRWISLAKDSPIGEQVYPVRLRDLP